MTNVASERLSIEHCREPLGNEADGLPEEQCAKSKTALANGAVADKDVSAKTRRNMPDPIPVMVLARLAVDSAYQKQGLGSALLRDALLRTIAAAQIAGIRAVLLHAMSDDAKRFDARAGFHECAVDPMMMMITLAEVEKNLSPPSAS